VPGPPVSAAAAVVISLPEYALTAIVFLRVVFNRLLNGQNNIAAFILPARLRYSTRM
jgi:hypothetical protein